MWDRLVQDSAHVKQKGRAAAVAATALVGLNRGLSGRVWSGAQLSHSVLDHAIMSNIQLQGAVLSNASMRLCNLIQVKKQYCTFHFIFF